ncbi:helix-turn-helix domain-containing protein [Pantoea sp.]|uniref:helix-turn-helix domain-containing protein n=1 Tax=Pantoea sp. TaxID=69393 RepID=UPI0031E21C8A
MTDTFTKHYSDVQRITSMQVKGKHEAFSPADKAVYFYLLSLQENAGKVFPNISTLSRELGISERTVKRSLKWLQDALLIAAQRRYDNSNLYSVTPPYEVVRLAGNAADSVNRIKVIARTFSAKTIEAVLYVLCKMGVIHEDASPAVKAFTKAREEPLDSVKTKSVDIPLDYNVEPVIEHSAKSGDMSQEECEVCEWTGERTPKNKIKEQPEEIDW